MIVLGIDPGLRHFGYALVDVSNKKVLQSVHLTQDGPSQYFDARIRPDHIVIEIPIAYAKAAGQMIRVAYFAGVVACHMAAIYRIQISKIHQSPAGRNGWKKFYGNRDTETAFLETFERDTKLSEHEMDAALMAYALGMELSVGKKPKPRSGRLPRALP